MANPTDPNPIIGTMRRSEKVTLPAEGVLIVRITVINYSESFSKRRGLQAASVRLALRTGSSTNEQPRMSDVTCSLPQLVPITGADWLDWSVARCVKTDPPAESAYLLA